MLAAAMGMHLKKDVVVATSDEAIAMAGEAATLGLVQGLRHAPRIVQQRPPVHHHLQLPALHGRTPLRPVDHHCHLPLPLLLPNTPPQYFTLAWGPVRAARLLQSALISSMSLWCGNLKCGRTNKESACSRPPGSQTGRTP